MPLTPERQHLNEVMEARRLQLHGDQGHSLTWVEVATRAKISVESIHAIRRGQAVSIRSRTQEALERGLQLPSGTIKRILDGEVLDLDIIEVTAHVTDEDVEKLVAAMREQGVPIDALTDEDRRLAAAYTKALADKNATQGNGDDTNRRAG